MFSLSSPAPSSLVHMETLRIALSPDGPDNTVLMPAQHSPVLPLVYRCVCARARAPVCVFMLQNERLTDSSSACDLCVQLWLWSRRSLQGCWHPDLCFAGAQSPRGNAVLLIASVRHKGDEDAWLYLVGLSASVHQPSFVSASAASLSFLFLCLVLHHSTTFNSSLFSLSHASISLCTLNLSACFILFHSPSSTDHTWEPLRWHMVVYSVKNTVYSASARVLFAQRGMRAEVRHVSHSEVELWWRQELDKYQLQDLFFEYTGFSQP